jgi:hypothetical protein
MSTPLIAQTQAAQVPWLASTRRSNTSQTAVVAAASMPVSRSRSVVLTVAAIASGARPLYDSPYPVSPSAVVTLTITVSRLVTEPRPWVTAWRSGTETGSASMDAMVSSFIS